MKIPVSVVCDQCKRMFAVLVEPEDMEKWRNGALIQNAMPYLSADDRELLISKTCGKCFEELFEEEEEDDDDL